MRSSDSLFRDVACTVASVIAVLACFECGLRLAGIHYQGSFFVAERERGYALRPGAEGWETVENDNYVRINSQGLNDREHTFERPAGTIRIAVVGSSEAESKQVPREDTFEAILQRDLARVTGQKIEVLNFGVPGYGLSQEYLTVKNHVWHYDPQIVVLLMSVYTVLKNVRSIYPNVDNLGGTPFFTYENGRLVPDAETRAARDPDPRRLWWKQMTSYLMNRIELLGLANEANQGLSRRLQGLRPAAAAPRSDLPPQYIQYWTYLDIRDPQTPIDPRLREAWRINDDLLRMMRDDTVQHHAEFWLITTDATMQTDPDLQARAAFQRQHHLRTLFASEERLTELARAENMHAFFLAPPLAQYVQDHKALLHGFAKTGFAPGHWNQLGHQVVGDLIAQELLKNSEVLHKQ